MDPHRRHRLAGRREPTGNAVARGTVLAGAELYDPATRSWTKTGSMLYEGLGHAAPRWHGPRDGWHKRHRGHGSAELYIPAGASPPPDSAPVPSPTASPTPTPFPTPYPPQAGPVPAGARSWTVTVVNSSSAPGTLLLAEEFENGIGPLCGSVTPNVVPAGVTMKVTFLLPPKRVTSCWIWLDPVPGKGDLFQTSDAPLNGKIVFREGEQGPEGGWLSQ